MGDIPQTQTRVDIIVYGYHRLRLLDGTAISPTICYAAGTWTPNEEFEETDTNDLCSTDDDSGDGLSTTTHNDVDSEVSFEDDADEEIDTTLIEEEDWIEYIKRSTDEAKEKMESAKIRCWNKTHKKMKWKLALRIAT